MQESPVQLVSRRQMLNSTAIGFGGLALRGMLAEECRADSIPANPLAPRPPHFVARAKRVIFLFMHGGPSHVDLFDPKPRLARDNGKPLPFKGSRVRFAKRGNLMQSPWQFKQHGQSGIPMSQLWQHLPTVADDLCMMHSVCETNVSHGGACMKIHTGEEALVRPSMGAWVSYGLGTENQDLPSYLTICPTSLHGGVNNFGTAFLPAVHQGVPLGSPGYPNTLAKNAKFDFMTSPRATSQQQRLQLELLKKLHIRQQQTSGPDAELDARIQSFELAFRMQSTAPEAMDVSKESKTTRALHATIRHLLGLDHTRLTYPHAGRDFRLTDVYGEVAKGIIA